MKSSSKAYVHQFHKQGLILRRVEAKQAFTEVLY